MDVQAAAGVAQPPPSASAADFSADGDEQGAELGDSDPDWKNGKFSRTLWKNDLETNIGDHM